MAYTMPDGTVSMAAGATTGALAGTAIMPGIGTAIGAGLGLLGGWLGSSSSKRQQEAAMAAQREALQNSIQWRVADARKAGIHPLYALGAPSMQIAPMVFDDPLARSIQTSGQDIGEAINRQLSQKDKLVTALQLDMLTSQAAKARADAGIAAETEFQMYQNRFTQGQSGVGIHNEGELVNPMGQVPAIRGTEVPGATMQGFFENKPPQRMSPSIQDPAFESQKGAGYQEWEIRPGFYLTTPMTGQESWREVISEMSTAEKFGLLNQNATIYGGDWLRDYLKWEYFGQEPKNRYHPHTGQGGMRKQRRDIIQKGFDFFEK